MEFKRLLVVSNRLPLALEKTGDVWDVQPGTGGLVTAMTPVLQDKGGLWIGWPGTADEPGLREAVQASAERFGYDLDTVALSQDEVNGFYYGFANEILWPLFHGFETRCNFEPAYWRDYESANCKFAQAIAGHCREDDFVWIHDYHLMTCAREARKLGVKAQLGFFLHIPFPTPDVFFKLPWRKQILEGLLSYDLVGFQTLRDRRNFSACLTQLRMPELRVRGRGSIVDISWGARTVRAGAFAISLDYDAIDERSRSEEIAEQAWVFHEQFPERQIMIGMDRLDYTKGIPERLEAFRLALQLYPELRGNLTLVQITVPSREKVPEYEHLREQIERLVGEINGEFTEIGDWVPIHYVHRSFGRDDVFAMLRASEIAIITPLRDGMNLVAKEFAACHVDERGVLILSEFAGVAAEFKRRALLVNPYDQEWMAEMIHRAFHMDTGERQRRMRKLREIVKNHNIFHWVDSMLGAVDSSIPPKSHRVDDFVPDFQISSKEPGDERHQGQQ